MKKKNSFLLYTDSYDCIQSYTDAELGILLRSIFEYELKNEVIKMPENIKIAFNFIKKDLDRNRKHYEEVCEKNRENANARWQKKDKKAKCKRIPKKQSHAMDADNDNDNDVKEYIYNEKENTSSQNMKLVLNEFNNHYKKAYGINYATNWKKDMMLVKKLLATQELSVVLEKIEVFFNTEMSWITGNKDFGIFINQYNKLNIQKKTSKSGVKYL